MALAVIADLAQMVVFPLFIEGAASPADDVLDLAMAGVALVGVLVAGQVRAPAPT